MLHLWGANSDQTTKQSMSAPLVLEDVIDSMTKRYGKPVQWVVEGGYP